MYLNELLQLRLANQLLLNSPCTSAPEVVSKMGAMQAQNYLMAKWAIGSRLPQSTDEEIEKAFNNNEILRTHVLRPTWHFVSPADIRWMLQLTGPRIASSNKGRHRALEIDEKLLNRSNLILESLLRDRHYLTRKELTSHFESKGINTSDNRMNFLLMHAELEGLICSAGTKGKQLTYGLLDETVPQTGLQFTKEESQAELALRYFCSHGPATTEDFAWWSGQSLTAARNGILLCENALVSETFEGEVYWLVPTSKSLPSILKSSHLLAAFDEFLVGYKDRSATLDPSIKKVITNNGIFHPTLVQAGATIGMWNRKLKGNKVSIDIAYFHKNTVLNQSYLEKNLRRFGDFIGLPLIIN